MGELYREGCGEGDVGVCVSVGSIVGSFARLGTGVTVGDIVGEIVISGSSVGGCVGEL